MLCNESLGFITLALLNFLSTTAHFRFAWRCHQCTNLRSFCTNCTVYTRYIHAHTLFHRYMYIVHNLCITPQDVHLYVYVSMEVCTYYKMHTHGVFFDNTITTCRPTWMKSYAIVHTGHVKFKVQHIMNNYSASFLP